jgi:hypothetical protein
MSDFFFKGATFDLTTRDIDVLIVCEDVYEGIRLKHLFPYAYVVVQGSDLRGVRVSTIWASPRVDKTTLWFTQELPKRLVLGAVITTMDASEY